MIGWLHATVKIMPLGDSITWDWRYFDNRIDAQRHGYRNYLWYLLQEGGYDVDFVGSRHNGSSVLPPYDGDNEGHTGWTTHQIADKVYGYMTKNTPDIVLLHIGTNDSAYYSVSGGIYGMERILDEIDRYEEDYHRKVYVIVAYIIDLRKDPSWVAAYNSQLKTLLASRIAAGDAIVTVDMYRGAGLSYWGDLHDGIHPTDAGYRKMAKAWYNALKPVLDEHFGYPWLVPLISTLLH